MSIRFCCWIASLLLAAAYMIPGLASAAERGTPPPANGEAIRAHVEFLAHDLLEGRAAASRGHDLAVAYVASHFRQYGLKPARDSDSYLQVVPLIEATPVLPGSSAQLAVDGETHEFEYGTDYLPAADFFAASSTLSAPLVFVGYAISAPELNYDDFAQVNVAGRIAVMLTGAPPTFDAHARAYYSSTHYKFSTLAERGAFGVVLVDSPDEASRFPWERRVAMSWTPQMRWLDAQGEPQDAFAELKLRFRFKQEAAARFFANAPLTLEEVLEQAEKGTAQGFELPGMLTLSATTGLRRTESANVIAMIEGSDPQLRDEYVVITAHLDHLGRGSTVNGDAIYNGAHDNAVGIGIILETARLLQAAGRTRRSILFAAVTAEEKGLLGSDYLVAQAQSAGVQLVANINVDMPRVFVRTADIVALGAEHSTLGSTARAAASAYGYRLSPDATPEQVSFIRSDQYSFIRRAIPALALRAGYEPRDRSVDLQLLQRTYLDTHYHQPSDDLSLPIDYTAAADLARIVARIAHEAAMTSARPRWNSNDFFQRKFGAPADTKITQRSTP